MLDIIFSDEVIERVYDICLLHQIETTGHESIMVKEDI
jgi:hypothetical protein